MASGSDDIRAALRFLYGIRRQFRDGPARSARAKATIRRTRPWESGRIGKIEKHISRKMTFAPKDKLFTTGELARAIYANPTWDQDFNLRIRPYRYWWNVRRAKGNARRRAR
jgi:hypothetical protein